MVVSVQQRPFRCLSLPFSVFHGPDCFLCLSFAIAGTIVSLVGRGCFRR